jgi:hypothetical protein
MKIRGMLIVERSNILKEKCREVERSRNISFFQRESQS